ncbi:MAG TPA: methionine ABC transporter ATP-binding protein, partial [Clostridiales bacterium UBA8960]|nr:methionine ABC transporter ATP-binding protein [Clostridiales bacterium UBA8960]
HGKPLRQARQGIGMIFQNFNLLSSKTVYENVAFPLRLQNMDSEAIHERVMMLLEKVELSDKAKAYPINLSGGQKQRVGIARALANAPDVLLCDEATSALDPKTTKQILELLKRINQELGVTLVVITHEMDVIKSICNRVAILESGKVIAEGGTIELFTRPTDEKTRHFLGEVDNPLIPQIGERLALTFAEGSAKFPVLSRIIRKFEVDINILSGTIESIQDQPVGKLVVEIELEASPNTSKKIKAIIEALHAENVVVETISEVLS